MLNEILKNRILQEYQTLYNDGSIPSKSKLSEYYNLFKDNFGVHILQGLDGEELLIKMHDFSTKDSLVYWLEFKNEDDFPAIFGSLAGGSALKYRIYKNKNTGEWTVGSPTKQISLSIEDAIEYARQHKEQLIAGYNLLESLSLNASDKEYQELQKIIEEKMPDLYNLAWAHKYLSLLFPNKLDDYHSPVYQRFYLLKMMQTPFEGDGRYNNAGKYIQVAKELDIPINSLTTILNRTIGKPHSYWRIGTTEGDTGESKWESMKNGGFISVGWSAIGDLSELTYSKESREKLKALITDKDKGKDPRAIGNSTSQLFNFATKINENDIVIASDGQKCLGIGRVKSDGYFYDKNDSFPHKRPVEWLSFSEHQYPQKEGLRTTVRELKNYDNILSFENGIIDKSPISVSLDVSEKSAQISQSFIKQIDSILSRKKQVILYGPPGTGKTYWASKTVNELSALNNINKSYEELSNDEIKKTSKYIYKCTFHPSYGYEEFIEGYYPKEKNGVLFFINKKGIFKTICEEAISNKDKKYYLLIDEINRGDIPRIFGELITLLEKDKRGVELYLPSGETFHVPENVFIIATMNTADRSIALLDTALRRRFGFIELMPDVSLLKSSAIKEIPLSEWLDSLNNWICENLGLDSRNLQIGHAYFLEDGKPISSFRLFRQILKEDVIPLLQEYCYENYQTLESILGKGLVDVKKLRIKAELFDTQREDELIQALIEPFPEIATSSDVALLEEESSIDDEVEDVDE